MPNFLSLAYLIYGASHICSGHFEKEAGSRNLKFPASKCMINLNLTQKKKEALVEFLRKYGELASWDEWLAFLEQRPELKGFDWARSFFESPSSEKRLEQQEL